MKLIFFTFTFKFKIKNTNKLIYLKFHISIQKRSSSFNSKKSIPLYQKVHLFMKKTEIRKFYQTNEIIEGSREPNQEELKNLNDYLKQEESKKLEM